MQVIQEAVKFYVDSCADDTVEERQVGAVLESAWDALDRMLCQLMTLATRGRTAERLGMPHPAAICPAGVLRFCHQTIM